MTTAASGPGATGPTPNHQQERLMMADNTVTDDFSIEAMDEMNRRIEDADDERRDEDDRAYAAWKDER